MVPIPGQPPIQRRGVWEPLPLILYGYALHPLSPSRRDTRLSNRTRVSTYSNVSEEHLVHRDVVSLEVGDEVYAFEKYTPRDKDVEGVWYRGYVVCTNRQPPVTWLTSTDPSSSSGRAPSETQQVFIGIFPASHIFVRDENADAEGLTDGMSIGLNGQHPDLFPPWAKDATMEPLREDDGDTASVAPRKSFKITPHLDSNGSMRARLPAYAPSFRSASPTPTEANVQKPLPPRPLLRFGDDTGAGAEQPIVDEIASALREWHTLMFQYLARRDYKLFQVVRDHIEILHRGRRQLLAQTLSAEETVTLRKQCVARLVSGNIAQGLDIVVRHPIWGGLVNVDVEGDIDSRSWVSAVRMYAMQAALAYTDTPSFGPQNLGSFVDLSASVNSLTRSLSILESPRQRGPPRATNPFALPQSPGAQSTRTKFYHVFLELRAFVASPCAPGETAELFFSLYNSNGARFVSEEFCAVLNHNGVLARDPTAKIRTLFTDVVQSDAQDPIYLVCRIVRNGSSMKMGGTMGSIMEGRRPSEPHRDGASSLPLTESLSMSEISLSAKGDPSTHFRRPFGCALLEITQLRTMIAEQLEVSSPKEFTMPIFVPSHEATFSMLHQDILNNNTKEFEKSPRADMMVVSVKVFYGDADTIIRENTSLLQDTPLSLRLGFPDVVFPGDVRNELYVKLWSGDFSSASTGAARRSVASLARGSVSASNNNVQVSIEVRDQLGMVLERTISQCSGEPDMSLFHSMVFQRTSQPTFGELIKVKLPFHGAQQLHLLFTFRHRSTRDRSMSRSGSEALEKPFAFAFLPLFPDGRAFLQDGSHTLALYRADKFSQLVPEQYLQAPSCVPNGSRLDQLPVPSEMQKLAPLLRDSLIIRSSLCSTKFTQNSVLLNLLNWEKLADKSVLSEILRTFAFVGEVEIVRFLQDIFNSLFAILISQINHGGEMDQLVFNALVTVLGIVQDRRFNNFQPVLDVYIERHFNCPTAAIHMVRSMNTLLQDPVKPELRAALKVWGYLFKFITRAREIQKQQEIEVSGVDIAEQNEQSFKRELWEHLADINRMMATTTPSSIIGTQTIALQHFTSILPELNKLFSIVDLVGIATSFANSIETRKGKIVIWKLIVYLQIVKGFLFDNTHARSLLVESIFLWIKPNFGRFDEFAQTSSRDSETVKDAARVLWLESSRLSTTVIAVMLDKLQQMLVSPQVLNDRTLLRQEQYNIEYLLSLVPKVLETYLEFQNPASLRAIDRMKASNPSAALPSVTFPEMYPFSLMYEIPKQTIGISSNSKSIYNSGLGESAVVFLVLALSASRKVFLNFLESNLEIEGKDNFATLLMQIFKVGESILNNDAFPSSWLNATILVHKVLIKIMDPIVTLLEREFVPDDQSPQAFDNTIWREAFCLLLRLLSSGHLTIEEFSAQKQRAVWRLAGDIRGEGAAILLRLWNALGWPVDETPDTQAIARYGTYHQALNSLVGHVINLCLSHHDQLRYNAVHILYCMIVSEFHVSGHFDNIENELVSKLDTMFMSDTGDYENRSVFIHNLRQLFEAAEVDADLRSRVTNFLREVDTFLVLLLQVRTLPEGEEFADDRVIATLRLMNFLRRIGRDEIYIKYVHQLVNMHLQAQNYVEAGLTLKLHADLHEWDLNTFAPPMEDLGLPQQSQFHRKETLCLLILDYLGKGKAWESAIEICKELAKQHGEATFNYARLAEILRHQATLLEHIVTDQRYYSDYFRVAFYGKFPAATLNKQFIYRGYEWEKFGAFCERMLNKHPSAQLLKAIGDPPIDIRFGDDQYIQCTAVTPEPNRELPVFTNPDTPPQIRSYYEHSAINLFSFSRPVTRSCSDGNEEVWIEKTYLTTEEAFPTVLRRSEILEMAVVEISPVETALHEVEQRTRELSGLNLRYSALAKTSQGIPTTPLSMSLNAAVDAPANTGISLYRQTFLAEDYLERFPERAEQLEKLRGAIDDQVRMIDSCLKLHGQLCPPQMLTFHGTLESFFRKNFQEEIARLSVHLDAFDIDPDSPYHHHHHHNLSISYSSSRQHSIEEPYTPTRTVPESTSPSRHFNVPPLDLARTMDPALLFGHSVPPSADLMSPVKLTPLQRHLAHLARHGLNGVASGPRDRTTPDSISENSPHESYANGAHNLPPQSPGSITGSTMGSMGSFRGRFSKFGSLNFSRKDN